jgi:2,3-bisphosphoglycerate-dependent phosphoglycerate mutase
VQLILARHGEPVAATAEPGAEGADPELSARGRTQASALGWWAANAPDQDAVAEVVTSPMRRARETAAPAADALGLTPVVDDGLVEFDAGRAEYTPEHERIGSGDPEWQRLVDGHLPTWVDAAAFTARVRAAVDRIVARHPGRSSVLVVCHAGVINTVLAAELGTERALPFPLQHTGLSRILVSRDGRRRVRSVNETGHVADLL